MSNFTKAAFTIGSKQHCDTNLNSVAAVGPLQRQIDRMTEYDVIENYGGVGTFSAGGDS